MLPFTGTWPRTLDDKGRLAIPSSVQRDLGDDVKALFVAPWTEQSLAVFTPAAFTALAERSSEKSAGRIDVRNYNRMFYARAERVDVDAQGRIRVPDRLRNLVDLQKDVVLLGVNDHLELWDAQRWNQYESGLNSQFDAIVEQAYE